MSSVPQVECKLTGARPIGFRLRGNKRGTNAVTVLQTCHSLLSVRSGERGRGAGGNVTNLLRLTAATSDGGGSAGKEFPPKCQHNKRRR